LLAQEAFRFLKKIAEEHQKSPWGIIQMIPEQHASAGSGAVPYIGHS
jgi:hypothetical protein